MNEKLKELRGKIEERRKRLSEIFEQAGPDLDMSKVTVIDGDSAAKVEKIREINAELDDLSKQAEPLEQAESELRKAFERSQELNQPGPHPGHPTPAKERKERVKGFTEQLFDSPAIKNRQGSSGPEATIMLPEVTQMLPIKQQLKTLFQTSAGWEPESIRSGRIDLSPEEEPGVTSLVPMLPISQPLYKFMRETTFTNAASETAEGGQYNEAALELTEAEEAVRKLTVWIPVTDEQLEDVPSAQAYIESRLRFMLDQKLDQRILNGNPNATPPQIKGFHNTANINTYALLTGTDNIPDAVYKGMTLVRTEGQDRATATVMHPNNWQDVRLMKTEDGIYIWGSPSEEGPARLWGRPVVDSAHQTEGLALTGAFASQSLLAVRRQVTVKITDSHDEDFIHGKQAIRADFRCALVTIRPQAFTEIDLDPEA